MQLQAHGQNDLPKLLGVGTRRVVARHAHHLHGNSAAAAHHFASFHVVDKRLHECHRIETRMEEKPSVFIFQEAGHIFRRIVVGGRKTPLSVVSNLRAEQLAVLRRQYRRIGLAEARHGDA